MHFKAGRNVKLNQHSTFSLVSISSSSTAVFISITEWYLKNAYEVLNLGPFTIFKFVVDHIFQANGVLKGHFWYFTHFLKLYKIFSVVKLSEFWNIAAHKQFWNGSLVADSIKRCHLPSIGNPILEIRRSYDRLISTMGFLILVRWHLYIESGPRFLY